MATPARLGNYEIQRHLATGGMAETYVALRRGPTEARRVCFKRIRADKIGRKEFVDQFEREARIAAGLRHANIVEVLDFGLLEGEPYLVLEFVEGADFGRLIRDPVTAGSIDPALVTHVAVETATALEFAHRSGVLHRDVSPCNILIGTRGELKLADFGIAKALGRNDPDTIKGKFKGKVAYVAPEYVRTSRAEPRGDLYSLGITLYEALCGQRPYDDLTALATFERAARGTHVPLLDRNPALPPSLCAIVEALIEPDPDQRPESASALLAQLQSLPRKGPAELAALVQRLHRYEPDPIEEAVTVQQEVASWLPIQSTQVTPLRRCAPWLGVAAVAGSVLCVVALHAASSEPAAPGRAPSRVQLPSAPAHGATAPAREEPDSQPAPPTAPQAEQAWIDAAAPAAPGRSTLRIAVIPYGQVWVDHRRVGRSPVSVQVGPGEHVVTIESPRGRFSRTVHAEPGTVARVLFR